VKWVASILAVLASFAALIPLTASAQGQRDPLIAPSSGEKGSRFQIVGETGWIPGEPVTIELAFTMSDPLTYAGPFPYRQQVTVLRDGTWSFPIVLTDDLGLPLGSQPGFIVVRATSPSKTAQNAFVYTVGGRAVAGAEAIADLGFGPEVGDPTVPLTAALFALGAGGLLLTSGAMRRRALTRSGW